MSAEDDLDEVYEELERTRSEVDTAALKELMIRQEAEAKNRARTQMYDLLTHDIALARRWLFAIANDAIHMDKDGSLTPYDNANPPRSPLTGNSLSEVEHVLEQWVKYPKSINGRHRLEDGLETELDVRELVVRTARRLQSDCFRLLNVVGFLAGRKMDLTTEHVDWMVPYLEGQLKLLKGEYECFRQEPKAYQTHDLDALAARHAADRKLSLEARIVLGRPLVDFEEPEFAHDDEETSFEENEENRIRRSRSSSAIDHVSPKTPLLHHNGENGHSMEFEMNDTIQQQGIIFPGHNGHKQEFNSEILAPDVLARIRNHTEKLIKSKNATEGRLMKALDISERLSRENEVLRMKLASRSAQFQNGQEVRQTSPRQTTTLLEEFKENAVMERHFSRGKSIEENIRAERDFQVERERLAKQLSEFEEWYRATREEEAQLGLRREESRVHAGHDELLKELNQNIKNLEIARESAWVNFVAQIDGISESDRRIWRALRGVTTWNGSIPIRESATKVSAQSNSECLYCDKSVCRGCSGDGTGYDKPWLAL
ncbi:hypothetical protein GLAREA_01462 [Glarea lozoyensis ATCC 20868]|uniref:Uncharacterized protein n=1 Tax=Glarea lozoyensis (strain ATCC 20868 / MF5171) TaxID=1116229 RepID=S3CI73_GLAL2|nr:uncharacterized protein GLAREA_01462 [Glarea lozoyensis ATCC 20868]EPE25550.1 hypothetical protein GLAREA_01462 [Glarea lozoyensis ATCC 20868]